MTQIYPVRDRYGVGKPGAIGGGTLRQAQGRPFRRAQVCQVAPKTEALVYEQHSEQDRAMAYPVSEVLHWTGGFDRDWLRN
jgi:hypothetical protein